MLIPTLFEVKIEYIQIFSIVELVRILQRKYLQKYPGIGIRKTFILRTKRKKNTLTIYFLMKMEHFLSKNHILFKMKEKSKEFNRYTKV